MSMIIRSVELEALHTMKVLETCYVALCCDVNSVLRILFWELFVCHVGRLFWDLFKLSFLVDVCAFVLKLLLLVLLLLLPWA